MRTILERVQRWIELRDSFGMTVNVPQTRPEFLVAAMGGPDGIELWFRDGHEDALELQQEIGSMGRHCIVIDTNYIRRRYNIPRPY